MRDDDDSQKGAGDSHLALPTFGYEDVYESSLFDLVDQIDIEPKPSTRGLVDYHG